MLESSLNMPYLQNRNRVLIGDSFLSKKIYVGNLSYETTEEEVKDLFAEFGDVDSIAMINDRETGRFRGFCFVEMAPASADAAIAGLNGREIGGRDLRVNEARPQEERGGGRRSGGGRPGGNRGGGRNEGSRGGGFGRRNDFPDSGGGNRW